jgi:hypothetical protein
MRLMMSPRSPSSRSVASAFSVDHPLAGADLVGEAEDSSLRRRPTFSAWIFVGLAVGVRREVDDAGRRVADKLAVELGPALGLDLAFERAADVEIGARPQAPA